jgi:hypothetical protein
LPFLWFIGVLRDRLGELEHRFFATVFLGSELCDNVLGSQGSKLTRNTTAQIMPGDDSL